MSAANGADGAGAADTTAGAERELLVAATADLAALAVARRFAALCQGPLAERAEWHVAVSGGSVAASVVPAMIAAGDAARLDWSRLHVWFADERFLDRGDPERNATPIAHALRGAAGFVPEHLHAVLARDEGEPLEAAAEAYAHELATVVPAGADGRPSLDLVLLGSGPDGHTASLFPGRRGHEDDTRLAIAVDDSPKPPPERVTLTFAAIGAAERVWAVATGAGKAEAVALAVREPGAAESPLGAARGRCETVLILDERAAAQLR